MKKAKRHYESWSEEEARSFLNYYLSNITSKEYTTIIETFAKEVDRTYDAIAFRVKEVLSILTEGEKGLQRDKWTKEFIAVVDEKLNEGSISKAKMTMLFD
jgi:hypothetical protein|tara:strand:- start:281 stop:583 length:303 start_codon:yes stop_codon:yes gene_type:complete